MTTTTDPAVAARAISAPIATVTGAQLSTNPFAVAAAVAKATAEGFSGFEWREEHATGAWHLYAAHHPDLADAESFAAAPLTVGERRAEKSAAADSWAPRDLLIKLLREHDAGTVVLDDIVVVWLSGDEFGFWNASKKTTTALGLLSAASHDIAGQSTLK